jgi:hypothetical protein
MRVWRICRQGHGNQALDGLGGFYASGRWHSNGAPYCGTPLYCRQMAWVRTGRRELPPKLTP